MIMDISIAAEGIDLSSASRVYFTCPVTTPANQRQAIKRAHRNGCVRPVYVETLVARGTVDEVLLGVNDVSRGDWSLRDTLSHKLIYCPIEKPHVKAGTMASILAQTDYVMSAPDASFSLYARVDAEIRAYHQDFEVDSSDSAAEFEMDVLSTANAPSQPETPPLSTASPSISSSPHSDSPLSIKRPLPQECNITLHNSNTTSHKKRVTFVE